MGVGRRRVVLGLAAVPLVGALAGCAAEGMSYAEAASAIPSLKPGEGRVYFYRTAFFGAAIQPHVYLAGRPIGKSQPGGFFFLDLPAGTHSVTSTTETRTTYELEVEAGKTQYIVMTITMGIVAGRVDFGRVSENTGRAEVAQLKYTGLAPLSASASSGAGPAAASPAPTAVSGRAEAGGARPPSAPPPTAAAPSAQRQVTLDDLSGLLPKAP